MLGDYSGGDGVELRGVGAVGGVSKVGMERKREGLTWWTVGRICIERRW